MSDSVVAPLSLRLFGTHIPICSPGCSPAAHLLRPLCFNPFFPPSFLLFLLLSPPRLLPCFPRTPPLPLCFPLAFPLAREPDKGAATALAVRDALSRSSPAPLFPSPSVTLSSSLGSVAPPPSPALLSLPSTVLAPTVPTTGLSMFGKPLPSFASAVRTLFRQPLLCCQPLLCLQPSLCRRAQPLLLPCPAL